MLILLNLAAKLIVRNVLGVPLFLWLLLSWLADEDGLSDIYRNPATDMTLICRFTADIDLAIAVVVVKMSLSLIIGILATCVATPKTVKEHLYFFIRTGSSCTAVNHFNRKHNSLILG